MNKLFAILIICSLSLPVLAIEEQEANFEQTNTNAYEEVQNAVEELNHNSEAKTDEVVNPPPKQELGSKYKQPMSKKNLAKKFIIAMLCVAGTSVFLYGVLSIYNKIRESIFVQEAPSEGEKPLETPVDLTEAVKTFIDKTHWES